MSMHFHRRTPDRSADEQPRPSNAVHVLSDEEDLRQALQRAAAFDQRVAEQLSTRSARYRALLGEAVSRKD